ncbi:hypothetical protein SAMN05216358_0037 [Rhizobium sp. AN5]|uniref:hypothetical protein n=1 Tax=Rhizobium sp. AN5 TaxID=1855304 RepID=UPI000BC90A2F|nr:hypothetical protein [Rhizobium sp. AN5]SOC90021.1 hypothetical protein SAMN05216358_0037 [Rhizobium sp. AN5]
MQVWFKNRKVGDAKVGTPSPGMREIRMNIPVVPASTGYRSAVDPAPPLRVERIALPLDVIRVSIDNLQIKNEGEGFVDAALARYDVRRSDCEEFTDFQWDATVFQYKIIRVTLSLLEEIFDYDWFEPADGERDPLFYQDLNVARLSALSANMGPISTGQITLSSGIRLNVRS